MKSSIAIALVFVAVAAAAQTSHSSDDKEMQELLSIVQQETAVATKTRLNSDYVPGNVTVLESDELNALGIRTAGEALGLVPGMQAFLDQSANQSVIVRGLDFPFNAGNIQVLVDGIAIARPDAGITTAALLIPVEQIDRIEVIRGPGSVMYGDFAFMGLVNIITKKQGTRVAARYEVPDKSLLGAARTSWTGLGGTTISANVARLTSDNAIGVDPVRNAEEGRTFGMASVQRGGFTLTGQTVRRDYEPGFAPSAFRERSSAGELRYGRDVSHALRAEAKLDYLRNDIASFSSAFTGHSAKLAVDAVWTGFAHQSWLVSADRSRSTIDDAAHLNPPVPGQPPGPLAPLASNVSREITGFTLQDRVDVNDAVSVTAGARYDSYSDLQSRVTPRVAVVWRVTDHHIVKAQYAEGFRPPTFFELYTPPAPNVVPVYPFEVNATTELSYIYRDAGRVGRLTLFNSILSHMLRPGGVAQPFDARARGFEAEWSQQITPIVKVDTNVSHTNTRDPRTAVPGSANAVASGWLGNVAFLVRPMPDLIAGARWNYNGDRVAGAGFNVVDLTVVKQNIVFSGLSLHAGIKNVLDERVTYLTQRPTGDVTTFVLPRRAAWVEVAWKR